MMPQTARGGSWDLGGGDDDKGAAVEGEGLVLRQLAAQAAADGADGPDAAVLRVGHRSLARPDLAHVGIAHPADTPRELVTAS
jgi:hypothetical protein